MLKFSFSEGVSCWINEEHRDIKKGLHKRCRFFNVSGKARQWLKFCCLKALDYFQEDGEMESRVCHKEQQNETMVCLAIWAGVQRNWNYCKVSYFSWSQKHSRNVGSPNSSLQAACIITTYCQNSGFISTTEPGVCICIPSVTLHPRSEVSQFAKWSRLIIIHKKWLKSDSHMSPGKDNPGDVNEEGEKITLRKSSPSFQQFWWCAFP